MLVLIFAVECNNEKLLVLTGFRVLSEVKTGDDILRHRELGLPRRGGLWEHKPTTCECTEEDFRRAQLLHISLIIYLYNVSEKLSDIASYFRKN